MYLEEIKKRKNRIKKAERLGRGYGSGSGGHTVGRGQKGQKSRSGHKSLISFEGGNVPFHRRMPKYRGSNNKFKIENAVVNLDVLDENYKDGDVITMESLKKIGLVRASASQVKILGSGEIKKKLIFEKELLMSSSAEEKIEKAGGTIK